MSLTPEDKEWIKAKCGKVDRTGLYFMVFFIFMRGCCPTTVNTPKGKWILGNGTNLVQSIEWQGQ